jgi:hypothetical protein
VDGADEGTVSVILVPELGAEAVDVDVEGVLLDVGDVAPAGFDELLAGGDEAAAAHEGLEQFELLAGEGDVLAVANGDAATAVEGDAADGDGCLLRRGDAAGDGADAGQQDFEDEGLDEVVVGSEIEGVEDPGDGVDGGEDENGVLQCLARTRSRTSKPSIPGRRISRRAASYFAASSMSAPSRPLWERVTRCPSPMRARSTRLAILLSSSMTSTFMEVYACTVAGFKAGED